MVRPAGYSAHWRNVVQYPDGSYGVFNPGARCRHCGERGCPRRWCEQCGEVTGYECKTCHDEVVHGKVFLPGNIQPALRHSYTRRVV